MEFPKLYHKTKSGKIQTCKIWTIGDIVYTEFGYIDGKKQVAEQIALPKNVGKSNETTGPQQAESEARSKWQKKLDKKYVEDFNAVEVVRIAPMLAKKYTDRKIKWPAFVQRKLNGLRCIAYWKDGEVVLQSRGNKFYNVEHIRQQLQECIPENTICDGELYIHGVSLQKINSLVKKPKAGSENLEYHIYDLCKKVPDDTYTFMHRVHDMALAINNKECPSHIKIAESIWATSKEGMKRHHIQFVKEGYEGTIIRNLDGIYRFGFRSDDLLKYKDFEDEEFTVVGFTEGTGKFIGTPIWACVTEDNKQFNVTPTGSLVDRKAMFSSAQDYIGRKLTVRFIGKTDDGIPNFGVGIVFRLDSDLGQ